MTKRKAIWFMIGVGLMMSTLIITETAKSADNYPTKPVRLIVARGSGGSTDVVARTLQPYFSKYLGRPVVIENVDGASGKIGNKRVYDSAPDGYTLLFGVTVSDILVEVIEGGTSYEMQKFVPIYNIAGGQANVLIAAPNSGIKNLSQLINKAKTTEISVANTAGVNVGYLAMSLLKDETGIPSKNINWIPYKSSAEVIPAVMGGHVMIGLPQPPNIPELLAQGKLYAPLTFSKDRVDSLPDVPTLNETYPGNYFSMLQSIFAPPGTPAGIVTVLENALRKAVSDPAFIKQTKDLFTPEPMSSSEFAKVVKQCYTLANKSKASISEFLKKK